MRVEEEPCWWDPLVSEGRDKRLGFSENLKRLRALGIFRHSCRAPKIMKILGEVEDIVKIIVYIF